MSTVASRIEAKPWTRTDWTPLPGMGVTLAGVRSRGA
jgi:hypothetical protein